MIRGIALDFDAAHRALIDAGFSIEKNVIECDCYVKKEQKVITAQDETLVVWTLTCDSRSDDVLFDDYEGLLDYLTAQVESRSLGEEIRFSITVSRMTRRQYDELPEFDL